MKFLSRECKDSDAPNAEQLWLDAMYAYGSELATLKPHLRGGFARLPEIYLHDAVLQQIDFSHPGQLTLVLQPSRAAWAPSGLITLAFAGVTAATGLKECLNDIWLYEELSAAGEAVTLCVLFVSSEISITAKDMTLTIAG